MAAVERVTQSASAPYRPPYVIVSPAKYERYRAFWEGSSVEVIVSDYLPDPGQAWVFDPPGDFASLFDPLPPNVRPRF